MPLDIVPASDPRHNDACQEVCASIPTWHCIYTKPKAEKDADEALRMAGFQTFFPRYQMVWRDRTKVVRPLFPRYTFVRFDSATAPWRIVVRDRFGREAGQLMLEPTSRRPLDIPDAVVDALLAQTAIDGVIYPKVPRIMLQGDAGRVLDGPLSGFQGICSRTSKDRVWLLLAVMGGSREVDFSRELVEIAA